MTILEIGAKAPEFSLPTNGNKEVKLSDYLNKKNVVLYFYPKDDTLGCTNQANQFKDLHQDFIAKDTVILGASKDTITKHDKFVEKYELPFPLISDLNGKLCEDYGVWVEKSMYGKKYMGIERTTFLISKDGKIQNIWRKVKVKEHAKTVLKELA